MTLKVLIINPPIRLNDAPRHIPHGLAIIANIIRKDLGIIPGFIDVNAYRYNDAELMSILRNSEFNVVLMGGLIPVYKRIIRYAGMVKEVNPEAVVIAGGSAAMSAPHLLLENSRVDIVCSGEGEKAIINLLKALASDAGAISKPPHVKGFYFKDGGNIIHSGNEDLIEDLDKESDIPAYDLLPMNIYLSNPVVGLGRDTDFISSRGCPYNCTFCYQPWGRKFRAHSADFIIKALSHLRENYSVDFISFQDDEFMADKKRVYELCGKIKKFPPGLLWSCTGRANLVDEDIVAVMRRAGCVSISYGFESGSRRMLKSMNKMLTIEQMENAIRISRKFGMMLPISFIIGMPGEDESSCGETVDFCIRNAVPLRSIMFATPYPGTELFDFAVSTGRIKNNSLHEFIMGLEDARDFTINLTDAFSDEELKTKRDQMIKSVCSQIRKIPREIYINKLKNLFGKLADDYFKNDTLLAHRAQHGGIDIF